MKKLIAVTAFVMVSALSVVNASAQNRWVNIINDGNTAIRSVRMSPVSHDMGEDLLGSSYIQAGESMEVEPSDEEGRCRFYVEITYESGDVLTGRINTCEVSRIVADENQGTIS